LKAASRATSADGIAWRRSIVQNHLTLKREPEQKNETRGNQHHDQENDALFPACARQPERHCDHHTRKNAHRRPGTDRQDIRRIRMSPEHLQMPETNNTKARRMAAMRARKCRADSINNRKKWTPWVDPNVSAGRK